MSPHYFHSGGSSERRAGSGPKIIPLYVSKDFYIIFSKEEKS